MGLPRLTYPTTLVLYAVARGHAYGFDVIDATRLGSGTVYPILRRLEAAGLLSSREEAVREAHDAGRPPRRYYTVTRDGAAALR
ncbi:MAG TPA: PadR family transcriptional regulator, partial [Gemmatimonadales bacterium]